MCQDDPTREEDDVELTVKEYAQSERVDERTVRRWIAKGAVPVRRTPGGGIRIRTARVVILSMTNHDNQGQPSS
jgi:excisionase family DNA binding protein